MMTATSNKPTATPATVSNPSQQNGYIVVMTRDEIEQLTDILDNPFLPLNDLQKALFMRGFKLVRV